jgi:hypothetical protein
MAANNFAVNFALFQVGQKRGPKLHPLDFAQRLAIEKGLQQQRYCNAFALWRHCRLKPCRRAQSCAGDASACLKRALDRVPHDMQRQARQDIIDATPRNIGAPERKARQSMPRDLYE